MTQWRTRTSPEPEKITLAVKDVKGEARHLFNAICRAGPDNYEKSRGDVLNEMIYAKAVEVFGEGGTKQLCERYQVLQSLCLQRGLKTPQDGP